MFRQLRRLLRVGREGELIATPDELSRVFRAWQARHGKAYADAAAEAAALDAFAQTARRRAARHNAQRPPPLYTMGLTHFADVPLDARAKPPYACATGDGVTRKVKPRIMSRKMLAADLDLIKK